MRPTDYVGRCATLANFAFSPHPARKLSRFWKRLSSTHNDDKHGRGWTRTTNAFRRLIYSQLQ